MRTLTATLCALLLTSLAAFAADKYPSITTDQLKQAIAEKKVVLLDANGTDTYKAGHIPGALDFDKVEKDLAAKLPKDKGALIVAYCGDENCPAYAFAADKAKELGYTNIKHYAPGIAGWKKTEKTEPGT
jgi:rhodanese-related sulfurtransferase